MRPDELTVTALVPATATLLRSGDAHDQYQRLMELEQENRYLKQAMSELMMEKTLLKVALEARYQSAPQEPNPASAYDTVRIASQRARSAGIYVAPGILGTHLRASYGEVMNAPLPDSIAEFIKKIEKGHRSGARRSLIGQLLSALAPMRFARSGR